MRFEILNSIAVAVTLFDPKSLACSANAPGSRGILAARGFAL